MACGECQAMRPSRKPARLWLCAAALPALLYLAPQTASAQAAKAAAQPAPAAPRTPPPTAPAPADADAAFAASKAAFDALSGTDRRAVQEALIWTGDFQGAATGEFGKRTRDALIAFEKRVNNKPDGTVDAKELARLTATAQEIKKSVGFAMVSDAGSGVQIGVPAKLLPARGAEAGGQTFASASGDRKLSLFSVRGPDADLTRLFEKTAAAAPDRKITYKLTKPDYFVVTGETGASKFYTRAARASAAGEAVLRGFTITYPLAAAKDFEFVALAIANSFNPAPASGAQTAAAEAGKVSAPTPPPVKTPAAGIVATATLIASGKAVAILPAGCTTPTIAGAAARIAGNDAESGMTLLELPARAQPVALGAAAIADGDTLVVAGFSESAAAAPATLSAASGAAMVSAGAPPGQPRVLAPVQAPAAGSAVFDQLGRLVGIIGRSAKEPRRYAGVTPITSHAVIALPNLLRLAAVAPPPARASDAKAHTTGEIINSARASLLGVECGK